MRTDRGALSGQTACGLVILGWLCNALTIIAVHYQEYMYDIYLRHQESASITYHDVVVDGIWLAPSLILLIWRRNVVVTAAWTTILLMILLGRIYYLLPSSWTGVNVFYLKKIDWASILLTLLSALSVGVILVWLSIRGVARLGRALANANRGRE
jgi:hypothetical protein